MMREIACQTQHRLHHRHAAFAPGKMRTGNYRECLQSVLAPGRSEVETVGDRRDSGAWPGGKAAQIEGQAITQQFEPRFIARAGAASGWLSRITLGNREFDPGLARRIMAEKDALLARDKVENRGARGPLARREQQMQPCGPGVLRQ
jgi:hypothetical protein